MKKDTLMFLIPATLALMACSTAPAPGIAAGNVFSPARSPLCKSNERLVAHNNSDYPVVLSARGMGAAALAPTPIGPLAAGATDTLPVDASLKQVTALPDESHRVVDHYGRVFNQPKVNYECVAA
jgi:hypothetical protein